MTKRTAKADKTAATTAVVPTGPGTGPMAEPNLVNMSLQLDKDDVIMVGVARAEQIINDNISKERAAVTAADKETAELGEKIETARKKHVEELFAARATEVLGALKILGIAKAAVRTSHSVEVDRNAEQKKQKTWLVCTMYAGQDQMTNRVSDGADGGKGRQPHITGSFTEVRYERMPEDIMAMMTRQKELARERERAEHAAVGWKKKLMQVPVLERQMRARVAEQRLKLATGGEELLAAMMGKIESDILRLPGA